ncbi:MULTISPECIES: fimbrial protein [Enterobacterales]|uniref:fimbrial protein n=1 Tax=Enterobacterales TaxID=91347 RepID=UPI002EDADCDA
MKINIFPLRTLLVLAATGLSVPTITQATDGTVNFTGEIIADACQVDSASQNLNVNLGKVAATSFSSSGAKSSPTAYKITLSSCPESATGVTIKYDGNANATNPSLLKLDPVAAPGTAASGVGIEIADATGTIIPLQTASAVFPVNSADNTAILNFVARYVSTTATVTPGIANGTSQFTLNYQ